MQLDDRNSHTCINSSDYVQFSCTVGGSSSLQWRSEYFGTINRSRDFQSDAITRNGVYIQVFVSWNNTDGTLTSILSFSAVDLPADGRFNITCHNNEVGTEESISYSAPAGKQH